MKVPLLLLLPASLCFSQKAPPVATPTQAGRQALSRAQSLRDSLVAERWNAQRQHLEERDNSQQDIDRLRDSLEAAKELRDQALADARRTQSTIAQSTAASTVASPASVSNSDPLESVRKQLQDRVRILRDRVKAGPDWGRAQRLSRLDSTLDQISGNANVSRSLSLASSAWIDQWEFTRKLETRKGSLPRPEGTPAQGIQLRAGSLGSWYARDTSLAAILLRTSEGSTAWEWREDLVRKERIGLATALSGQSQIFPLDPGTAPLEFANVFEKHESRSWGTRLANFLDFQKGPLHLLALWAARAVMVLLLGMGVAVAWISWQASRRMKREEEDANRYAQGILAAFTSDSNAADFANKTSDTVAGRLVRTGFANRSFSPEALEQICIAQESAEARELEKGLGFLGSVGSNAPFIGLFGTVCGILDAFAALGKAGSGPQAVMGAIAEALVATATGLLVAIPAIWIYNVLQARAKDALDRAKELRVLMIAASLEAVARRKS
jgi:biopolymer transport protein ExbB/TolQ